MNVILILALCFITMKALGSGESIINHMNAIYVAIHIITIYNVMLMLSMGSTC